MVRSLVQSSNVHEVGYDPYGHLLEVKFKSGDIYQYPDVSPEEHDALMKAESIGFHFAANFKKRDFKKVQYTIPAEGI